MFNLAARPEAVVYQRVQTPRERYRAVIREVAVRHGVALEDILSVDRATEIVRARDEAMATLRDRFNLTYPQLGVAFGRHHSACIVAVRRYRALHPDEAFPDPSPPPFYAEPTNG